MGIKYLLQNLKIFDEISILEDLINEPYYEDIKNIIGYPYIESYICHIDFSILMHKILLTSENMNIVLKKIKIFLLRLKKYNNIFLYIDPDTNIRKKNLQITRNINKTKTVQKVKQNVIKSINNNNLIVSDNIKELLHSNRFDQDNYITKLSFYMTNDVILDTYVDISDDDQIDKQQPETNDKQPETNDKQPETNDKQPETNDKQPETNDKQPETNDKQQKTDKQEITKSLQKQTFGLFCNIYDFKKHEKYILNYLTENKIISENNIIFSDIYDAEINIIHNININNHTNNVIYSCDQDVLLFSLLYFKSKYIYIKNDINPDAKSLILIKNSFLNKNLAYLTIFFNKSDYFNGIYKFKVTPEKLKKLCEKHIYVKLLLSLEYENNINLLATFIKFYTTDKLLKSKCQNLTYIDEYINNLNEYLSMNKLFYTIIYDNNNEITLQMIIDYISQKNPYIYTYTNNKITKKLFNDF